MKSLINRQTKSERLRRQSGAALLDQPPEIQAVKIPAVYALGHHSARHSAHHFYGHPEPHPGTACPAQPGISALPPRGSPSICAVRMRVRANKLCTTKMKLFPQTTKFHHSINSADIVLYVYSLLLLIITISTNRFSLLKATKTVCILRLLSLRLLSLLTSLCLLLHHHLIFASFLSSHFPFIVLFFLLILLT